MLGEVLNQADKAAGGKQNLALGGLGALAAGALSPLQAERVKMAKEIAAEHAILDGNRKLVNMEAATAKLLGRLVTHAPPKDREAEAAKARARSARRFG